MKILSLFFLPFPLFNLFAFSVCSKQLEEVQKQTLWQQLQRDVSSFVTQTWKLKQLRQSAATPTCCSFWQQELNIFLNIYAELFLIMFHCFLYLIVKTVFTAAWRWNWPPAYFHQSDVTWLSLPSLIFLNKPKSDCVFDVLEVRMSCHTQTCPHTQIQQLVSGLTCLSLML